MKAGKNKGGSDFSEPPGWSVVGDTGFEPVTSTV